LRSEQFIGQIVEVLVEKISKKSTEEFSGRNSQSITVVFPKENYKIVTL
jgi:tRNA-2-methylthio-N6-dimethylallyladenosine synthase